MLRKGVRKKETTEERADEVRPQKRPLLWVRIAEVAGDFDNNSISEEGEGESLTPVMSGGIRREGMGANNTSSFTAGLWG